jgi:hypothetical protein
LDLEKPDWEFAIVVKHVNGETLIQQRNQGPHPQGIGHTAIPFGLK